MHSYLSNTSRVESLARRESASEAALFQWANVRGINIRRATQREDMEDHIDFHLSANGAEISVELKGEKQGQNSGLFLIELNNVQGKQGWLYGKADYVFFQDGNKFLTVDLEKLRAEISKFGVGHKKGGKFCLCPATYSRFDRPKERVTWVKRETLEKCLEDFG